MHNTPDASRATPLPALRPETTPGPVLEVNDLSVAFARPDGRLGLAVENVGFRVYAGQTVCLVGESGCGKSVTALSVPRLLPEPPARIVGGQILFQGQNLFAMPEAGLQEVRGNGIGMVFQDPMSSLNPVMRIGAQISEVLVRHKKLEGKAAMARAVALLDRVGFADPGLRVRDYPHQMSGGQRQRVMIASALACDPALIIADEPTTALDVTIQKQILDLLLRLVREAGSGLLLISHDLALVAECADVVAIMYAGTIVEQGSAAEVFNSPLHPYTQGLLLSREGMKQGRPVFAGQEEAVPSTAAGKSRLTAIPGTVPGLWERPEGCAFSPRCSRAMPECFTSRPLVVPVAPAAPASPAATVAPGTPLPGFPAPARTVACWLSM